MCLILVAGKGKEKYSNFFMDALKTSAKTNTDGIGLGWKKSDKTLIVKKGFININAFMVYYENLNIPNEDEVVIHLRRVSSGVKTDFNCHPFICNETSDSEIRSLYSYGCNSPILFHNGHFSNFSLSTSTFSDTYYFVKDFFRYKDINSLLKNSKDKFLQTFGDVIGKNKIAVMYPNSEKETTTVGKFINEDGYLFSNLSYKSSNIVNTGGIDTNLFNDDLKENRIERRKRVSLTRKERKNSFKNILFPSETSYADNKKQKIKLSNDNCNEILLISNCVIAQEKIELGKVFSIRNYFENEKVYYITSYSGEIESRWVSNVILESCFDIVPKKEYKDKYNTFGFLVNNLKATKSSIKKIEATYNTKIRRKKLKDTTISIKYCDSIFKNLRLDGIYEFLRINKHLMNEPFIFDFEESKLNLVN